MSNAAAAETATPKFKWVHFSCDGRYELRETGTSNTFASIFTLAGSSLWRNEQKQGFTCYGLTRGETTERRRFFTSTEEAQVELRKAAQPLMDAMNSVAWAAGRPARQAAQAQAQADQERARSQAAAKAFARKAVTVKALNAFLGSLACQNADDKATAMQLRDELQAELDTLATAAS